MEVSISSNANTIDFAGRNSVIGPLWRLFWVNKGVLDNQIMALASSVDGNYP